MDVVPIWMWIALVAIVVTMLAVDFIGHVRKPHQPTIGEAARWTSVYYGIAALFGVGVWFTLGGDVGFKYYSGWVVEASLSIDNLFVFVLILASFRVPREHQQKVLLIGIVIALILRGLFIFLGAAAVEQFSWIFWIFGGFLLYTAYTQATHKEEPDGEFRENFFLRLVRRVFPTTDDFVGDQILVRREGKLNITPMLIVILAIGSADLLFAVDSIPAIFGVVEGAPEITSSQKLFVIFAANAFSLVGLRQLFFLIDGLLDRLVYLHYGLAVILAFIGAKLVIHAMHTNELSWLNGGEHITVIPEPSTVFSLVFILITLVVTAIASLTIGAKRAEVKQ